MSSNYFTLLEVQIKPTRKLINIETFILINHNFQIKYIFNCGNSAGAINKVRRDLKLAPIFHILS